MDDAVTTIPAAEAVESAPVAEAAQRTEAPAEPLCTVCNEPVPDDAQRGWVRSPGAGDELGGAEVLYHHRSCERDGRLFLAGTATTT